MSDVLFKKVEGHTTLVRDTYNKAIINTNTVSFQEYMERRKNRKSTGDEIRHAVKEINTLKKELFEIKNLLNKAIGNKGE
jgi:hypothetical protein|tara:strand:- start:13744 stop:13983 length:240 start_codon:yes stop_codon:yes gene_type:complete